MVILFIGPPGSGKGTQISLAQEYLPMPAISTGDLLRHESEKETILGKTAQKYMSEGKMVPDKIVFKIFRLRVEKKDCKDGFYVDGAVRSVKQTILFDNVLKQVKQKLSAVIVLHVDLKTITARIESRYTCPVCDRVYNTVTGPRPKKSGICDLDGAELTKRKDDQEVKVIQRRYKKTYADVIDQIKPVYRKQGILHTINGDQDIKVIAKEIKALIGELRTSKR